MKGFKVLLGFLACVLLTSAFEDDVDGDNYIVGGRPAQPGRFPWMVSLRHIRGNEHFCGGFVLSNRFVGTSGHCIYRTRGHPRYTVVVVGAHSLTDGVRHRIEVAVSHRYYSVETRRFDAGIIRTATNIEFNALVGPVRFPTGPEVPVGAPAILAGWGHTQFPKPAGQRNPIVLQWQTTRIITRAECQQRLRVRSRLIHRESICTSNFVRKGACLGDFGGPLIVPVPNRPQEAVIVGIASWSTGCARGYPDVYTSFWDIIPLYRLVSRDTIPNLPEGPNE